MAQQLHNYTTCYCYIVACVFPKVNVKDLLYWGAPIAQLFTFLFCLFFQVQNMNSFVSAFKQLNVDYKC